MRYIDKQRVLEYIIFEVVGKDITCGELKRGIENLSTIEVSERTGEWIEDGYYDSPFRVCSYCGYEHQNQRGVWKFCPNCGAKMKGDTVNE